MDRNEILDALKAVEILESRRKYNKIHQYYTDSGVNARDKYPKHVALMEAGKTRRIRCCMGANGSGKSVWLGVEFYFHMSGKYPIWWTGHRYTHPINAWLCGKENKILRDGLQEVLFGGIGDEDFGSGLIPREDMLDDKNQLMKWSMPGASNCVGQFLVKHYTNGIFDGHSKCEFKTYDQGWASYQGPTRDLIGFDEDPNDGKLITECLARLRSKDGRAPGQLLAAFSPTFGNSALCKLFLYKNQPPLNGFHPEDQDVFCQHVSLREVPHQTEAFKEALRKQLALMAPNEIAARIDGLPGAGSGLVFPVDLGFVRTPKQIIPSYWRKAFGMDPGQANFGMVWVAQDPNTNIYYVYDEYKHGKVVYLIHAEAVKARGQWIPGSIDPHEAVKPRDTGETVQSYFEAMGLNLTAAKGDPEAMRVRIRSMLESGSLKIMDNCLKLVDEIASYHYDDADGNKIQRGQEDHIIDALIYCMCNFDSIAESYSEFEDSEYSSSDQSIDDSERNDVTGY